MVERGPEKAGVGGSIPSLATTFFCSYPEHGCPAHGNSQIPSEKRHPTLLSWQRWRPWNLRSDACFLDMPSTLATGSSVCCEITSNPRKTTGSGLSYRNPSTPRIEPSAKSFLRFVPSSCWAGKSRIGLSFPATVRPLRRKPCTPAIYSCIAIRESAVSRILDVEERPAVRIGIVTVSPSRPLRMRQAESRRLHIRNSPKA